MVQWLVEGLAGLAPAEPGFRRLHIEPVVGSSITSASASVVTPYGRASSSWHIVGGEVRLSVEVPRGTTAEVHTGPGEVHEASAGLHEFHWRLP